MSKQSESTSRTRNGTKMTRGSRSQCPVNHKRAKKAMTFQRLQPRLATFSRNQPHRLSGGGPFRADAEPFPSRRDTRVMLFVLTRGPQLRSVLPDVILSEQSEYLAWEDANI